MTIADIGGWGKTMLARIPRHALIVGILVLATSAAFMLGILAGRDMERLKSGAGKGFWIEDRRFEAAGPAAVIDALPETAPKPVFGTPGEGFVASRNGTKYYLPACSGAKRIQEANKVWFATKADAVNAGYQPASACPGL